MLAVVATRNIEEVNVTIFLNNVFCRGDERNLLFCSHDGIGTGCATSETAGVICGGMYCQHCDSRFIHIVHDSCSLGTCMEGDVRLSLGYDRFREYINGEVRVCMSGVYRDVCDTSWDNQDASVICRQLGLSPYGAKHICYAKICRYFLDIF